MKFVELAEITGKTGLIIDGDWVESKDQDVNGDVRLIQLADIGVGSFIDKSSRFLNSSTAKRLKCTQLEKNDILIARMPEPIGRACLFPGSSMPCVTVVDVCILRPDPTIADVNYLNWAINNNLFQQSLQNLIKGTTRERISRKNLESVKIPLPALNEQRRIAQVLDEADRLRRLRRHATQQTETFLQSVFIEMFGDPFTNPNGWDLESLDTFILDAKNGYSLRRQTHENVGSIVLRIRDVGAGWIDYSDVNRIAISEKDLAAYTLQTNDLLLIRVNGNPNLVGRAALFEAQSEPIAFNDHIIRIRLNTNAILPEFILQLLNSSYGRMKVRDNVTTTAGQFTINRQGLANITFPLPPITKQQEFVKVMISLKRLLRQHNEVERQAELLFQSLLNQAFTGQLSGVLLQKIGACV